ncbi:MetQ/NlpA family ABC transporter substrate-binding protein [Paenibacillus sp. GYB003]|uniref:MetQ/NlpA family ABC transporter substrate-binding protein n=1 Tax=Paenibacillus sp. GYB003 TaxID=2994392 RepID=UPI002F969665
MRKTVSLFAMLTALLVLLAACGGNQTGGSAGSSGAAGGGEKKTIKFGATAGPYSDMVTKAIKPLLEKKGYKVELVEFNDYVQPNKALANGSIDANLFQHILYLKQFATDNKLDIQEVISVPTAPMGLYSNKFKTLDSIENGSLLTIANDPSNLARSLLMLQSMGLITVKKDVNAATLSEKDIVDNPKSLQFKPVEAASLPRTLDSTALAVVPGNFALAAGMDLTKALKLEEMAENYRNVIAIKTADKDSQFAKDLKEAVQSDEFEKTIDEQFKGFSKPQWMTGK